ncbi:MAG: nitrous oxide reductase accessory protein NosL [Sulfurovum sp.]|jgi:nitrous oxide reductase accessory protein NosL|nr:nitrous oxide reductase accessory protein NosL [Sulfurovum sp.]
MKKFSLIFSLVVALFASFFLSGCEEKDPNAVEKIHWDRDMCVRCVMVISDRKNAAQVINPENGKNYKFDDIGCAVLWFEEEKIEWKDKAKIWVTDCTTGNWIDARKAFYNTVTLTPMAYGLGAHESNSSIPKGEEVLNYEQMCQRVIFIENKKNVKSFKK